MMKFDFEVIYAEVYHPYWSINLAHADELEISPCEIKVIEKTKYFNKNLLDKNVYFNEISEIVRKMWGSFAILKWYIQEPQVLRRKRVFVIKVKIQSRFAKLLRKLEREVSCFKSGAYDEIKIEIV